jgi:hypothetical protein
LFEKKRLGDVASPSRFSVNGARGRTRLQREKPLDV